MNLDFTPRNIAKYAVTAVVHGVVAKQVGTAIADHTRFDDDDFVVEIPANIVGWGVSHKIKPYTDKVVDKTADFVAARREARKNKKKDTPEEK